LSSFMISSGWWRSVGSGSRWGVGQECSVDHDDGHDDGHDDDDDEMRFVP
jgi:hypothetical protein